MASFLEGQLAKAIASGFKGKLLKGTVERRGSSGVDEYGDPVPSASSVFAIEGFLEGYSAFIRAQAGIPESDSKLTIIAGLSRPSFQPRAEDVVRISGKTFNLIRLTNTDPAIATYECQVSQVDNG